MNSLVLAHYHKACRLSVPVSFELSQLNLLQYVARNCSAMETVKKLPIRGLDI